MTESPSPSFEPVIGLEIHVQLRTKTKMFCGCELRFGAEPNTLTCPVCLGLPGTLPVVNAQAVSFGLMIALAFGCEIAPRCIFHRKNYFYPDLPKGYQISQYDIPLARAGRLGDVRIHRAHLEEDAAKLVHAGESGRIHGAEASIVDFNRGGTPLVEIVTEPDLRSAADAAEWLRLLRATLRQIGVSDVNMEEGSLRCDANVSVRRVGQTELGVKTELKNMNSFRFLERGIEAEIRRQAELVEAGGRVEPETLHFDPHTGALTSLRSKEEVHDYRYFPEPDLVMLAPTEAMVAAAGASLPELPAERAHRFETQLGLGSDTARLLAFRSELGDFFEQVVEAADGGADAKTLANWVAVEVVRRLGDTEPPQSPMTPDGLAALVALVQSRSVSQSAAKEVLDVMAAEGGDPEEIVAARGLALAETDELTEAVDQAIANNPKAVDQVRQGKAKAIGALVGAVMRETGGRADGQEVQRLVRERLGE